MATTDTLDDEDIRYYDPSETGQPAATQPLSPPIAAPPPPQNIIMRGPVTAPNTTPIQLPTQQQAANDFQMRRLSYQTADLPIDQAEAAYHAALRYQGQRQYQQDLQSGMTASEALAKSAPLMFSNPKANVGEAAALLRAIAPKATPIVTPYQQFEITQRKAEEARRVKEAADKEAREGRKLSEVQKAELGADVTELRGMEKQIGSTDEHGFGILHPFGGNKSEMEALRKRAADLRKQIEQRYGGGTSTGTMEPPAVKEVSRTTKDGRTAIFDADTKKFLRYAQ